MVCSHEPDYKKGTGISYELVRLKMVNGLALLVGTTRFILCMHSISQGWVAARAVRCAGPWEVIGEGHFLRAFSTTFFHQADHGFDRVFSLPLFS